jgi:AcrR family transcriptional regulator
VADPHPSRRPRLSREFLDQHRRRRYVDAIAELLHEFGRRGLTVANIVRITGTARNSFYEVFRGVEDCIAYGIDLAAEELFAATSAQDGTEDWAAEVEAAICGFYEAVAADSILAELYLVHSALSRDKLGRDPSLIGIERFVALLRRGRTEAELRGRRPPAVLTEECLAAGIIFLAERRVRAPAVEDLPREGPAMTRLVGGYYLGFEEAGSAGDRRGASESGRLLQRA